MNNINKIIFATKLAKNFEQVNTPCIFEWYIIHKIFNEVPYKIVISKIRNLQVEYLFF